MNYVTLKTFLCAETCRKFLSAILIDFKLKIKSNFPQAAFFTFRQIKILKKKLKFQTKSVKTATLFMSLIE